VSTRAARPVTRLPAALLTCWALGGSAYAGDPWEFWPEANGFFKLNPQIRLYTVAAYARGKDVDATNEVLELAGYLDISLKPILRKSLRTADWQRSRFLWARIGYDHLHKVTGGTPGDPENRGIVSVFAKAGLPAEIWLEGRARADLRWIEGDYSTRYRLRLEATREFSVRGHPVVPYFNVEWFYDTRHDGWARTLYMLGPEVTVSEHFRFEVYLARQQDHLPSPAGLNALGFVAKWYY
jgi:hypothetical protein